MPSSTLGGTVNGIARSHILPPCREGRVSKVLADRLEVAVRSLTGDVQTLAARGWHPVLDRDPPHGVILPQRNDRAWVADDEGRALVVVAWEPAGDSEPVDVSATLAMVGDVKWTARTTAPAGWLACDGGAVTVASGHIALREALLDDGSPYGASGADPRVPDLRGRAPVGAGTGPGLTARTAGQAFGAETHQLTVAQMPTHTHRAGQGVGALTAGGSGFNQRFAGVDTGYNEDTGGSESHPNVQPSLCLLAIVKT